MAHRIPLSRLASLVHQAIEGFFEEQSFWIVAEVTDVKKYYDRQWCFLKFVEKHKGQVVTEMGGVLWARAYPSLLKFEKLTGKVFDNGMEVSCLVQVKFHSRFGLKLEVQEIDSSFTLGQMEMERQETLERLLRNYTHHINLLQGDYITPNKRLDLPACIQRIALIGAEGSDGVRDFLNELQHNAYNYRFEVTLLHASVQGANAVKEICRQLDAVHSMSELYDAVAMVRGGGSMIDLQAFDDYEVARRVAMFPIPVFMGVGHDRNVSVADLMGRAMKTPTRVAAAFVEHNLNFESRLLDAEQRIAAVVSHRVQQRRHELQRYEHHMQFAVPQRLHRYRLQLKQMNTMMNQVVKHQAHEYKQRLTTAQHHVQQASRHKLLQANTRLQHIQHLVQAMSPDAVLQRGFALIKKENKIITRSMQLLDGEQFDTYFSDGIVHAKAEYIKHEPS